MTTSVTTRAAGTRNPTRQQLDELDALLQRMLELPVHPLDEPEQTESKEAVEESPPPPRKAERGRMKAEKEAFLSPPPSFILPPSAKPPISYMVVETASPRPLPPASGFEPRPPALTLPGTPTGETPVPPRQTGETPVPPRQTGETPVAPRQTGETPVPPRQTGETPVAPRQTGETPVPPRQTGGTPVPPRQTIETPVPSAVPETSEGETWVPLRSTWQPSAQTWPPLAESWHQFNGGASHLDAPAVNRQRQLPGQTPAEQTSKPAIDAAHSLVSQTPAEDTDNPIDDAAAWPIAHAFEPRLSLSSEDAPVVVSWPSLPLLWFNQGFDACLTPLGAPGRWLCGPGRHLFGLIGLACLAAAVTLAVCTGMGWTW